MKPGMMNQIYTLTTAEQETIRRLLESQEERKIICERELSGFWFHDEEWVSELRILFLMNLRLTISRVSFVHRRKGTMTKTFELLWDICKRKEIANIVVQAVETREMAQWCRKNQFRPVPSSSFSSAGVTLGDYIRNVEEPCGRE